MISAQFLRNGCLQRGRRQIISQLFPLPPVARLPVVLAKGVMVVKEERPDITRGIPWKWIFRQQAQHIRGAFQEPLDKMQEPGICLVAAEGCKPDLPIQTRLVGGDDG